MRTDVTTTGTTAHCCLLVSPIKECNAIKRDKQLQPPSLYVYKKFESPNSMEKSYRKQVYILT